MKRMLVAGSIATLARLGSAGAARAAGAVGLENVGRLVKTVGGPAKNAAAAGICAG